VPTRAAKDNLKGLFAVLALLGMAWLMMPFVTLARRAVRRAPGGPCAMLAVLAMLFMTLLKAPFVAPVRRATRRAVDGPCAPLFLVLAFLAMVLLMALLGVWFYVLVALCIAIYVDFK
jgi:hypothetical protein